MSFGGSLFGNASSSTTTPASTTGGIGNIFANAANAANVSRPGTPALFGNSANATASAPAAIGGGLFGASAQPGGTPAITLQPPGSSAPTTNLFGNNTATMSAPAAPSGLFGNAGAQSAPAPAVGGAGVFGSSAATSAAPSGGLFGNAGASSTAPNGGLFGNTNAASAAPSGGLFGASAASSAPAAGGLFGASTAASQPAAAGGLFGASQPAQASSGGLFGASATNTNPAAQSTNTYKPLFGSLGATTAQQSQQANQPQQSQPQVVQGVRIDLSNVKPTTRFYELHESLQNEIIQAEEFIQSQINLVTQCGVFMPAHGTSLTTVAPDVNYVKNTLETVSLALGRDASEINAVKRSLHQDVQDCTRGFTALEHLKLPAQWQYSPAAWGSSTAPGGGGGGDTSSGADGDNAFAATDMVPYFTRQTTEVDARLARYRLQLAEIEAHLRTVEGSAVEQMRRVMQRQSNGSQQEQRGQVAELASAMHVFEDAVLRVAGKVGEAREGVIECTLGRVYANGLSSRR